MSKIRILPEILSNKIAAGEVVERPSSVVKELVENALDAGGTILIIQIEKGGRSLIKVSDNGAGMNRDDALLALERYATSKIFKDQDLFSISTLGFRGEALPSIASVSKFGLVARDKNSEVGTKIVVEGGKIIKVSDAGAPTGTMVTVQNLFYNTPARRKFLKTINTEMGHIADSVASIGIGRPNVQFKLYHNGNIVKNWSAVSDPLDRVIDVLGKDIKNDLYKLELNDNFISITGWISSPRVTRSTSRGIYLYVNGRHVRDRVIQHALFEGYRGRLLKGRFPVAVFFIRVAFDQVDVNVHPTKNEVRFAEQKRVHQAVIKAVSTALNRADKLKWAEPKPPETNFFNIAEDALKYNRVARKNYLPELPDASSQEASNFVSKDCRQEKKSIPQIKENNDDLKSHVPSQQTKIWHKKRFSELRVIGQLLDTYIVCESYEGIILIDQHAAHERILFEQLKNRPEASTMSSQSLLIPETIDMGYQEAEALKKMIPDLNELGLEIEPFGENTFVIKTVPAILKNHDIKPLIVEIVEKMVEIGFTSGLERAIEQCLILMACHGALRANQRLSDTHIKGLLDQLDECRHPSHCPHGRPTWIRWSKKSLEKSFKRIVA